MAKYKIFVDGSSGTTGLRIADRLAARDEFEILHISEADRKDVNARAAVINQSDLSFLCLPDAAAREVVPLLRPDVRILDTSTAHRTAPDWVYGLPELHGKRDALRTANRVAVPGCYATGFITLVAPLGFDVTTVAVVERLDPENGTQRLVNLVNAWTHAIKEMMGGMGINSIEALRGNRLMLRGVGLNEKELQILGIKHAGE